MEESARIQVPSFMLPRFMDERMFAQMKCRVNLHARNFRDGRRVTRGEKRAGVEFINNGRRLHEEFASFRLYI